MLENQGKINRFVLLYKPAPSLAAPEMDVPSRQPRCFSLLFLVGMRCSGKTTIGLKVAGRLGYAFVDTDARITETCGLTVAEIVSREGWPGFRRKENRALRGAAAPDTVVATGGGAVLRRENRLLLRENGICFYLSAPVALLAERLRRDPKTGQRPALTEGAESLSRAEDALEREMEGILRARENLYREAAHYAVDAALEPEELADRIIFLASLAGRNGASGPGAPSQSKMRQTQGGA